MTTPSRPTPYRPFALALFLSVGAAWTAAPSARAADPGFYSPADFGAVFDGKTNGAAALQKAIDAATAAGGGTVVMPAGRTLLTGSFELKSHVTLRLDPGSRIVASTEQADYSEEVLIRARHAEDVAITGTGTVDGQGDLYMISKGPYIYHAKAWRPKLVMFEDVHRAHLTDFTLTNAPRFTVQFRGCDDVTVLGISIYNNPEIPNNDGIDPVCSRNVRIIGCTVVTGDDCIAISNTEVTPHYGACDNIIVSNCVLSCQDSALKIGSGTFGDVRNIMFTDCVVKLALRGVDIMARDAGNVENVVVRNILIQTHLFAPPWWGASEAVYITAVPRNAATKLGHVRGIHVSGIVAHGEAGVFIRGTPDSPIEDVHLEDVTLDIAKTTPWPSRIDLRPNAAGRLPQDKDIVVAGFDLQDAQDVTLRNCLVRWGPNPPANFGPMIQAVRVAGLHVENMQGTDAHPAPAPAAKPAS
jgi:polygalacturonase